MPARLRVDDDDMSTIPLRIAQESRATTATATATERDRRRSERVPQVMDAWIASPTATDPKDGIDVKSINLSRHGVGFLSKQPVAVGTFYILMMGMGEQQMVSEIRVASCRADDKQQFEIGAEFS